MTTDNTGDQFLEGEETVSEDLESSEGEPASPEEMDAAAHLYSKATGEDEFPRGPQFPHAGNIAKKIRDHEGKGTTLSSTIVEIFKEYSAWRKATFEAKGDKSAIIAEKVRAFESYSSFLDTPPVQRI